MTALTTAMEIARAAQRGEVDPVVLLRRVLDELEQAAAPLNALRTLERQEALTRAGEVAARLARGEAMPLAGVPVVIKDNIAQAGRPNAAGRASAGEGNAAEDAEVVTRLHRAGAVVVGRANMDELAYGVTGTNLHTGPVRNPHDPSRHPGGSSAGSGALVGTGKVPLALGTDTGGSVRIPAALCGVLGLRPTAGSVPTRGVAPLCPSLDAPGPLAATVDDLALLWSVLAARPGDARAHEDLGLEGLRGTALLGAFPVPVQGEVLLRFEEALGTLEGQGLAIARREIPELVDATRASGPIIGAEASFAWAELLERHPEGFSEEVAGLLRKGTGITAARYLSAQASRRRVVEAIDRVMEHTDMLLLPTTAGPATSVEAPGSQLGFLALTTPFSLSGHPALSVPMGLVDGLPVGLQIVAHRGAEPVAFAVARALTGR